MKAYYPVDATGNRIGLKTPEAAIYDASGTNLTTKINNINSGISNRYTKAEVDSKVSSLQSSINSKYSASGGTLNGDLAFPEAGATNASSHGITWSGSTDTAKIYYKTTSQDQGNLVFQMGDDAGSNINFEWNNAGSIATASYITSDGVYHGKATNASYADSAGSANSVAWGNVSGKPATYAPSSHTHSIDQVTNLQSTINTINSNINNRIQTLKMESLYKSYGTGYTKTSNIYDLDTYGDFLTSTTLSQETILNSIINNNLCVNVYNKNMTIPKNNINNGCTFLLSFNGLSIIHFMDSGSNYQPTYYSVIIMISDSLKKEANFYLVDYAHFYSYGGDWSASEKVNMNFMLPVHFENNNVLSRIDVIYTVNKGAASNWPLVIDCLHKFNIDYIGVEY